MAQTSRLGNRCSHRSAEYLAACTNNLTFDSCIRTRYHYSVIPSEVEGSCVGFCGFDGATGVPARLDVPEQENQKSESRRDATHCDNQPIHMLAFRKPLLLFLLTILPLPAFANCPD